METLQQQHLRQQIEPVLDSLNAFATIFEAKFDTAYNVPPDRLVNVDQLSLYRGNKVTELTSARYSDRRIGADIMAGVTETDTGAFVFSGTVEPGFPRSAYGRALQACNDAIDFAVATFRRHGDGQHTLEEVAEQYIVHYYVDNARAWAVDAANTHHLLVQAGAVNAPGALRTWTGGIAGTGPITRKDHLPLFYSASATYTHELLSRAAPRTSVLPALSIYVQDLRVRPAQECDNAVRLVRWHWQIGVHYLATSLLGTSVISSVTGPIELNRRDTYGIFWRDRMPNYTEFRVSYDIDQTRGHVFGISFNHSWMPAGRKEVN